MFRDFDSYFTDDTKYVHCDVCNCRFDLDEMAEYSECYTVYVCPSCHEERLLEKESEDEEE